MDNPLRRKPCNVCGNPVPANKYQQANGIFRTHYPRRCHEHRYIHSGDSNPAWKGGRQLLKTGYVRIWTPSGHIFEHRHIWQEAYGKIPVGYELHHKNGIKHDNRLENLELLSKSDHSRKHPKPKITTWAIKHTQCIKCGTTKKKHRGHGYCITCGRELDRRKSILRTNS